MSDYAKQLLEERNRAWEQAKEILDRQRAEKRERSAEENEMFERANADIERLGKEISDITRLEQAEKENAVYRDAFAEVIAPEPESRAASQPSGFEAWVRGQAHQERSTWDIDLSRAQRYAELRRQGADAQELRAIYTDGGASGGSLEVPVGFERSLYEYLTASSAVRQVAYVFTSATGGPMTFPKLTTHGVGTQVSGQGTTLAGTDPVFGTMRLDSYRYGQLVKVSEDSARDVGFPLLDFIARNIGRALGVVTDTDYVTGSGSSKPNGVVTAISGSVVTGGSLITADFEDLINLYHSVVAEYRARPSCAWLMEDSTAGTIRKLRDGAGGTEGAFIWTPAQTIAGVGPLSVPDNLLGKPVYTDTNVAVQGSNAKSVIFGDWSAYYVRDVGAMRIERSDDRYFDTAEIGFRGQLWTDADLIDTNAIKYLKQNVS